MSPDAREAAAVVFDEVMKERTMTSGERLLHAACPECDRWVGQAHREDCAIAPCLLTGLARRGCREFARAEPHDCGEAVWIGRLAGPPGVPRVRLVCAVGPGGRLGAVRSRRARGRAGPVAAVRAGPVGCRPAAVGAAPRRPVQPGGARPGRCGGAARTLRRWCDTAGTRWSLSTPVRVAGLLRSPTWLRAAPT